VAEEAEEAVMVAVHPMEDHQVEVEVEVAVGTYYLSSFFVILTSFSSVIVAIKVVILLEIVHRIVIKVYVTTAINQV
jgi:hypothetical protein